MPEDGYQGEYVAELAAEIPDAAERDAEDLAFAGGAADDRADQGDARALRRRASTRWFSERTLHEGEPTRSSARSSGCEKAGHAYRSEGALWLRTTDFGDDKDRVIVRSTGEPTYFAADVAYLENKLERGFDRLITPLGADHHGYVARLKAALAALGGDPDRLEIPLLQFVHIVERGERASMSKRRGEFVTLDDLVDRDRRRRHALLPAPALARLDDRPRPRPGARGVGREPRLLRPVRARADRLDAAQGGRGARRRGARGRAGLELHPAERELIKKLLAFPAEAAEAAERRAPHRIAVYALELAQTFTAFYRDCQVVGAEPRAVEAFRLAPVRRHPAHARPLAGLLGVAAPETM